MQDAREYCRWNRLLSTNLGKLRSESEEWVNLLFSAPHTKANARGVGCFHYCRPFRGFRGVTTIKRTVGEQSDWHDCSSSCKGVPPRFQGSLQYRTEWKTLCSQRLATNEQAVMASVHVQLWKIEHGYIVASTKYSKAGILPSLASCEAKWKQRLITFGHHFDTF